MKHRKPSMRNELQTRISSGLVLAAAVCVCTWISTATFLAMLGLGVVILWREWRMLTAARGPVFLCGGALYIGAAAGSLYYLRLESLPILFATLILVATADVAGYFVGRRYGRHKIAPRISPGKSWEGLAGSVVATAAMGAALGSVAPLPHAILGALIALIGLSGDLFESALKRQAGVKDSGRLIPGHGGLFDRVDALLPVAIFSALALYIRLHLQ